MADKSHEEKQEQYLTPMFLAPCGRWYPGAHQRYGSFADHEARQAFFDLICQESPESVLDVGCGKGQDSKHIMELGVRYTGVDPIISNIEYARKRYPDADFKLGFIQELPLEDNSFDWVWLMGVLRYVREDQLKTGIHECARVARKRIYICQSSRESIPTLDKYLDAAEGFSFKIWKVSQHHSKDIEYRMWEIIL